MFSVDALPPKPDSRFMGMLCSISPYRALVNHLPFCGFQVRPTRRLAVRDKSCGLIHRNNIGIFIENRQIHFSTLALCYSSRPRAGSWCFAIGGASIHTIKRMMILRNVLGEGFARATLDRDILELAEWGMHDYREMVAAVN